MSVSNQLAVRWGVSLAALVVGWYLVMALSYALAPSFQDHFEPGIAMGALRVLAGEQAFHEAGSATQYATFYGPNAYLVSAAWIAVWPDVIAGSKLAGACAGLGFCVVFMLACIRRYGRLVAMLQLAFTLAGGLLLAQVSYWNRPDPLQMFGVAIALLALTVTSPYWAAIFLGAAAALVVNLKIHSLLYLLPVIAVFATQRRWRVLGLGAVIAAAGLGAPFLASDLFSLPNYLRLLSGAAQHPLQFDVFLRNSVTFAFFALPLAASAAQDRKWFGDSNVRWFALALGSVGVVVSVIGSKVGAGPSHLLPLFPLLAWGLGQPLRALVQPGTIRPMAAMFAGVWIVTLLWFAGRVQFRVWTTMQRDTGAVVLADIARIREANPRASIQMGVAGPDEWWLYWYRPALRSSNPVDFLDVTTWMDAHLMGRRLPAATRGLLEQGRFDIVLVPKGGAPFTQTSYYPPFDDVFDAEFRTAFQHGYRLDQTTAYFDIYRPR